MGTVQRSTLTGSSLPLRRLGWRGARRAPCQMSSEFLTVQEVANLVRCEHRVVRKAIHRGELEAAMIGGRWLIREEAVNAWFETKRNVRPGVAPRRPAPPPKRQPNAAEQSAARLKAMG